MTTITVKTRLLAANNQKLPRDKYFSMEINLKTNAARVRYLDKWYPVESYRVNTAAEPVYYEAILSKPLPGHIYATQYAFLAGAPWQDMAFPEGKQMLVQHRNKNKRQSSSIIFWVKENGERKRKRVYGRVLETTEGKLFVPRVKEAI